MSGTGKARIAGLYRYPVKGLTAERLAGVAVEPGATLPFDRAYAIENGPSGFDRRAPRHLPKAAFIMLMRNERLALLVASFDDATATLEISRDGRSVARGRLDDPVGRRVIEQFVAGFMADELRGPPRIVSARGHSFSDVAMKCVSVINLASVREIGRVAGGDIDPLRFRGNVYVEGLAPWAEFDWVGATLAAGAVRMTGVKRITRCAATNVNPATAERDLNIPRLLTNSFGHADCGVYVRIDAGGQLEEGQPIVVDGDTA